VLDGVSPKFGLLPTTTPIALGTSARLVPLIVTPACSTGSTFEPELLNLNNPLPKQALYVPVSSSNLVVNFFVEDIYSAT
jgi:hypothetical protein